MSDKNVVRGIEITSPQKTVFACPDYTKLEVVRYYDMVAGRMFPYIKNRLLALVVCPSGTCEECFYKKHPAQGEYKGISVHAFKKNDGADDEYVYCDSEVGIVFEAQMNAVEFHVWGSTVDSIDMPDTMVFDLDPDEGMNIAQIRQGVRDLKRVLDELGLVSFLKTSGNKGYHVVVPFAKCCGWDRFGDFAKQVAKLLEERYPNLYTSNVRKINRKGKIFIDWIRNRRGATSVAPYSLRNKKGASVSMPITWAELDKVAPNAITIKNASKYLKKRDAWFGYERARQRQKLK